MLNKAKQCCEVGLVNHQETFKNTRHSSFVLYFRYTFALVHKILQLLFNNCHHKFVLVFFSLPQVVKDQEQTYLVNNIRQLKDVFFTITPSIHGPFQILKKINDNAYQLDLLFEYGVHSTFNISDLIPFLGSMDDEYQDLRANPLQADDVVPTSLSLNASTSPSPPQGPITRSMMKRIQMGLPQEDQIHHRLYMLFSWAKEDFKI